MVDTFMQFQDSMDHSAAPRSIATLFLTQRLESGMSCPLYHFLGMYGRVHLVY